MKRKAFTLIELLAVIAITTILLGLTFVGIVSVRKTAKITQARSEMAVLSKAAQTHYDTHKVYPKYLSELEVLRGNQSTDQSWVTDPWGTTYAYLPPPPVHVNTTQDWRQLTMSVVLQYQTHAYTKNYKRVTNVQIISAGPDRTFGPGGQWTPGTGPWAPGQPGYDDLANFHDKYLGTP